MGSDLEERELDDIAGWLKTREGELTRKHNEPLVHAG